MKKLLLFLFIINCLISTSFASYYKNDFSYGRKFLFNYDSNKFYDDNSIGNIDKLDKFYINYNSINYNSKSINYLISEPLFTSSSYSAFFDNKNFSNTFNTNLLSNKIAFFKINFLSNDVLVFFDSNAYKYQNDYSFLSNKYPIFYNNLFNNTEKDFSYINNLGNFDNSNSEFNFGFTGNYKFKNNLYFNFSTSFYIQKDISKINLDDLKREVKFKVYVKF